MIAALETWLRKATRHLSRDSAAQVRTEIQQHYELAREAGMDGGASAGDAERLAITGLGDARAANRQYRGVLLTSAEASLLRECAWEARAVCSRKWQLLAIPVMALFASANFFLADSIAIARVLLVAGIGMGLVFATPFLPVYTPFRSRVFRLAKWVVLTSILGYAFWPDPLKWLWLLASCVWPLLWIEWTRISIRRKLPVAEWPKQLYL